MSHSPSPTTNVVVDLGAGSIGPAIARRVSAGSGALKIVVVHTRSMYHRERIALKICAFECGSSDL